MKHNPYLKHAILETVENQLKQNNPKETKETFDRLVSNGHSESTVKEMIGAVVVENVYEILKHKKPFDKKIFVEKLSKLK